jgi:hypothetical protein
MTRRGALVLALALVGGRVPLAAQDTPAAAPGAIAPRFAGGDVWVMPMPVSPMELARRLTGLPPQELLDSTVRAITDSYLRALAEERAAAGAAVPDWTTRVAGQTVGLDSRYVHLGPIKIPSVLLALLPIRFPQVNPQQWDRQRAFARMKEDLETAGARQAIRAEFAEGVKAMRAEREAARAFAASQRRPPPPIEDSP